MAKDIADIMSGHTDGSENLRELRQAVHDVSKALKVFGKSHLADIGEEASDDAQLVVQEGRRILRDVEKRLGRLEKRAEKSVRAHPGAWATGLLGVIGFGLVLGLILRRGE